MPYQIQCNTCRTSAYADDLAGVNPTSLVECPPGTICCRQDHDHEAVANACPGGHGECPQQVACQVVTPYGQPCPGGHCGTGVAGCTVCKPVTITALPGSAHVTRSAAPQGVN